MNNYAVVFPGQGSQSIGMLADFYQAFPEVRDLFARATEVLGYDLWEKVALGPENILNQTEITQPAMLVSGYALWCILQKQTNQMIKPAFLAGHSLGEYTALLVSGVLEFEKAVDLVAKRGRFMQEAVPLGEGAMAAIIGLEEEQLYSLCNEITSSGLYVAPANFNSVGQIVIAGTQSGVKLAMEKAQSNGARMCLEIPVSAPAHCQLMESAAIKLSDILARLIFALPNIPIVHNVDVAIHHNSEEIKTALVSQLSQPVRWVETIRFMNTKGVKKFIEVGPGRVLSGLIKRIDRQFETYSTDNIDSLEKVIAGIL